MKADKKFFNTTLGLSMLPDGTVETKTLTPEQAAEFLKTEGLVNAANPSHANTLQALTQKLGVELRLPADAKAPRIYLESGDQCLVAEVSGIPRETREFGDAEIAAATFKFRLVTVK